MALPDCVAALTWRKYDPIHAIITEFKGRVTDVLLLRAVPSYRCTKVANRAKFMMEPCTTQLRMTILGYALSVPQHAM
jgi:hypothetical protein